MQITELAQGSWSAAQIKERSWTGPPEPSAPAAPLPPELTGVSGSLCLSKIATAVKGTSESSPEIINGLSEAKQQIICRCPGGMQVWLALPSS